MYNSPTRNNKLLREAYQKGYRQGLNEQGTIGGAGSNQPFGGLYANRPIPRTSNIPPGGGPTLPQGGPVGGGQTKRHRGGTINGVCYDVVCMSDINPPHDPICWSVPCGGIP